MIRRIIEYTSRINTKEVAPSISSTDGATSFFFFAYPSWNAETPIGWAIPITGYTAREID